MPAVAPAIFACDSAFTLFTASLIAATIRSSVISASDSTLGSILHFAAFHPPGEGHADHAAAGTTGDFEIREFFLGALHVLLHLLRLLHQLGDISAHIGVLLLCVMSIESMVMRLMYCVWMRLVEPHRERLIPRKAESSPGPISRLVVASCAARRDGKEKPLPQRPASRRADVRCADARFRHAPAYRSRI